MNIQIAARVGLSPLIHEKRRYYLVVFALSLMLLAIFLFQTLDFATRIDRDARAVTLLGGDLRINAGYRDFDEDELAFVVERAERYARIDSFRSMVSADSDDGPHARLSQIRAVDTTYPLVGQVQTDPAADFQSLIASKDGRFGAVATDDIVSFFDLEVGSILKIGDFEYEYRGKLESTPDFPSFQDFLLPTIVISAGSITAQSKATEPGLLRQSIQVILPDHVSSEQFKSEARRGFGDRKWQIIAANNQDERQFRLLNITRSTLIIAQIITIALYALVLTTMGFVQLDIHHNTDNWLRELGVSGSTRFLAIALRLGTLILIASALAVGLAYLLVMVNGDALQQLPIKFHYNQKSWLFIARQATIIFVSIVILTSFLAWFLAYNRSRGRFIITFVVVIITIASSIYRLQQNFDGLGKSLITIVGLFGLFWVFFVTIKAVIRVLERRRVPANLAMAMFAHHNSRQELIGTLLFVLVTLVYIFSTLGFNLYAIRQSINAPAAASHFVADLLPEQRQNFESSFATENTMIKNIWPIARLHFNDETGQNAHRLYRGDFLVAFFGEPHDNIEVLDGEWWDANERTVSAALDINLAEEVNLGVGDMLTVATPEGSREVTIGAIMRARPGSNSFYSPVIFNDASHIQFPYSYVVAIDVPEATEGDFYHIMDDRFSNAIIVSSERAQARISQLISAAISGASLIALNVLLAATVALVTVFGIYRRKSRYEIAVLNYLGASRFELFFNRLRQFSVHAILTLIAIFAIDRLLAATLFEGFYQNEITEVHIKAFAVSAITTILFTLLFAYIGWISWQIRTNRCLNARISWR